MSFGDWNLLQSTPRHSASILRLTSLPTGFSSMLHPKSWRSKTAWKILAVQVLPTPPPGRRHLRPSVLVGHGGRALWPTTSRCTETRPGPHGSLAGGTGFGGETHWMRCFGEREFQNPGRSREGLGSSPGLASYDRRDPSHGRR